ncbi:hypothetical protein LBMAG53_18450 [Planctomycetota bacterium]|nr:hypothetical protein LBMAG53_18450 [Planctomycetota bacterium]
MTQVTWLARGDWGPDQVVTELAAEPFAASLEVQRLADAEWDTAMTEARRLGRTLFDGPLLRCARFSVDGDRLRIRLCRTSYRMFWGTNVRRPELPDHDRADPLGTSAVIVTSDGFLVLGRRSPRMALHPGRIHPFGGCAEPPSAGQPDVFAEIAREIAEECQLTGCGLRLRALVRDPDLRQPELLFTATTPLALAEVQSRIDPDEHHGSWSCPATETAVRAALADPELTPVAVAQLTAWLTPGVLIHER